MNIHPDESIFNIWYNLLYLLTAIVSFFFTITFYIKGRSYPQRQYFFLYVISLLLIILFGTRGQNVGTDTLNNIRYFMGWAKINDLSTLNDLGLYTISIVLANFTSQLDIFLSIIAALFIGPLIISIHLLRLKNPLLFFFAIFSFFFFLSMGINIQKQGIAYSFFILGMSLIFRKKYSISSIAFLIAFIFHASIIIPISILLLAFKFKNINLKYLIVVYLISTLLAIINFNLNNLFTMIPIVNEITETRLEGYYSDKYNYKVGFRPEFWVFNTIFGVLGYFTLKNIKNIELKWLAKHYQTLFIAYIGLSSFFFIMFSASFSDRFGILSWTFIPFLLLPYFQTNRTLKIFNTLTIYTLCIFVFVIFKWI